MKKEIAGRKGLLSRNLIRFDRLTWNIVVFAYVRVQCPRSGVRCPQTNSPQTNPLDAGSGAR